MFKSEATPIKQNPTLKTLIPPLAPNSFAYIVGVSTKWPPSQLNDMHTQTAYRKLLALDGSISIIEGKEKAISI